MSKLLLGKSLSEIENIVSLFDAPKYRAKQIANWLYIRKVKTIDDMSDLPAMLRSKMKRDGYEVGRSEPYEILKSSDGTEKYLFKTVDGGFVETVYIPDRDRATVCVSCQVGCKMNCLFCQTGKQGFHGNLTASDILNQIFSLVNSDKVTNVVFMGQGEPFDNLDNVMSALNVLTSSWGLAWSPKRITISTVGLKKNLKRFLDESDCHLAISLHTPYHKQRLELMPAERQFTIEEIVNLLRGYDFSHQRRLSFEYIMFSGLNDDITAAKELVKLLHGLECRVNLIRFHKIPNVELYGCEHETMIRFRDYLTNHGVFTTIRASRGEDIFAACGLLSTAKIINNIS
jgi:23S rRNA (adenine2503-C2)-methyltransferase